MRIRLEEVSAYLILENSSTHEEARFQGSIKGAQLTTRPLSFHFSFRWDIKPSWKYRPYITFGFGAASGTSLKSAVLSYSFSGELTIEGITEYYQESDVKTVEEMREESEVGDEELWIPSILPFLQLNLGLKGEVMERLHVLVDFGIWNGFLLRGGIAYRF